MPTASNASALSPYQESGASSYPSFNETLSSLQAESEPELQNETASGSTSSSRLSQSETSISSASAQNQFYYGNPASANPAVSNYANWHTNSQNGPSEKGSADSTPSASANGSKQHSPIANTPQPLLPPTTKSAMVSDTTISQGESSKSKPDSSLAPDASEVSEDGNTTAKSVDNSNPFGRQDPSLAKPGIYSGDIFAPSVSRDPRSVVGELVAGGKAGSSTPAQSETRVSGSQSGCKSKQGKTAVPEKGTNELEAPGGDPSAAISEAAAGLSTNTESLTPQTASTAEPRSATASPVSPNAGSAVKGKGLNADLAFAVKVEASASPASDSMTPSDQTTHPSATADAVTSGPFLSELKTLLGPSGPEGGEHSSSKDVGVPAAGLLPAAPSISHESSNSSIGAEAVTSQQEVSAAAEVAQDKAAETQTLKSVQIRVTGEDNQQVDLRLVEKSGALTVSVRSADASLTRALQQNLPDLSTKLNDQQVRTEWWTPDAHKMEPAQKPDDTSARSGGGHSGSQNQSGQNKGHNGQQGGRDAPKPDWVEQLSDLRNSNQNGKQYLWQL